MGQLVVRHSVISRGKYIEVVGFHGVYSLYSSDGTAFEQCHRVVNNATSLSVKTAG
jgi:hypothetical protein